MFNANQESALSDVSTRRGTLRSNDAQKRPKPFVSPAKAIVFSVLLVGLAIGLAEASIRVWAYYFRTSYERYDSALGRYELVPNTRFAGPGGAEFIINSKGFIGPEFEAQKPEGLYRIFTLGDSCSVGYWKLIYPGIVQSLLGSSESNRKFEIISAGIESYNSTSALARLKEEVLQYQPDMVTIYIGWNDLMKINPANIEAVGQYSWLGTFMEQSYLVRAYRKLIFFYVRPLVIQPKVAKDDLEAHEFDNFVPEVYKANLEGMLELLREQKIKTLLLTLPTVVLPGMTAEDLKRQHVVFPYYAGAYSIDKFLSLHSAYNRTIRAAASKYDVPVLDLDTIFNAKDKRMLFWDTMHPSELGHQVIATHLVAKIRELTDRR